MRLCYSDRAAAHLGAGVETGSWRRRAGLTYADADVPPCCNPQSYMQMIPWCGSDYRPAQSGLHGSAYYHGRSTTLARLNGFGCTCRDFHDELEWHPQKCRLQPWNATLFCELLGSRNLLFVGDSTMAQLAVTVMNMVHWGFGVNATTPGCQERIHYGAADTLISRSFGRLNRGWHWRSLLDRTRATIVVMSMGPHIHIDLSRHMSEAEERSYVNHSLMQVLQEVTDSHQQGRSHVQLIWRTQPPAGCGAAALPTQADVRGVQDGRREYNWGRFGLMDDIAKAFWAGRRHSHILDLTPLNYRVEAHPGSPGANGSSLNPKVPDCLHLCDGPLRLGAVLLLNLLAHLPRRAVP